MPANTKATHVRIVVVNSQCTGAPAYQGEQDYDPLNPNTDCSEYNGSPGNAFVRQNNRVRINELQVFSTTGIVSQR